MSVEVRVGTPADAPTLATIQSRAARRAYRSIFPSHATKPTPASLTPAWQGLLDDPIVLVLVACTPAPVGCVALVNDPTVPTGCLLAGLYVTPRWWSRGIGALLHDTAITAARQGGHHRLNLWVLEANQRARTMYEQRGWTLTPDHTRPNGDHHPPILDVLYEFDTREHSGSPA